MLHILIRELIELFPCSAGDGCLTKQLLTCAGGLEFVCNSISQQLQ